MEPTSENVRNHLVGYLAVVGVIKPIHAVDKTMACVEPTEIADVLTEKDYYRLVEEQVRPLVPVSLDQFDDYHKAILMGDQLMRSEYRRRKIVGGSG